MSSSCLVILLVEECAFTSSDNSLSLFCCCATVSRTPTSSDFNTYKPQVAQSVYKAVYTSDILEQHTNPYKWRHTLIVLSLDVNSCFTIPTAHSLTLSTSHGVSNSLTYMYDDQDCLCIHNQVDQILPPLMWGAFLLAD